MIFPPGPRNFLRILGETFRIYARNLIPLLPIAGAWGVLYGIGHLLNLPLVGGEEPEGLPDLFAPSSVSSFAFMCITGVLVVPFVEGAIIQVVSQSCVGETVGICRA